MELINYCASKLHLYLLYVNRLHLIVDYTPVLRNVETVAFYPDSPQNIFVYLANFGKKNIKIPAGRWTRNPYWQTKGVDANVHAITTLQQSWLQITLMVEGCVTRQPEGKTDRCYCEYMLRTL